MKTLVTDQELIELIYAALLGESTWQLFLERLAGVAPGCWSVMHSNSTANEDAVVGLVSGRSASDVEHYPGYYHGISPWAEHCQFRPSGKVTVVEDYVSGDTLEHSEFYNDFLRPIHTRSAIGIGLGNNLENSLLISIMTPNALEDKIRPIAAQLQRIAPHLQRAREFYRRTSVADQVTELGGTLLESLEVGLVIVGYGRKIRSCSETAQSMFGTDVSIDPLGRLRLGDPMATTVLEAMLQRRYNGPTSQTLVVGEANLTLTRMGGERERSLFEGPGVCLTMARRPAALLHDTAHLAKKYKLTPGEYRVLKGLIDGRTIREIATQSGRSYETIRSQLKSLCAKTETGGQTDLLRMVAGMQRQARAF